MRKGLLRIRTNKVSLEEHRQVDVVLDTERTDPDVIVLGEEPGTPVVDAGVGTGDVTVIPEVAEEVPAPASVEVPPVAEPTGIPSADAPTVPVADGDAGTTPPAAGEVGTSPETTLPTGEPAGDDGITGEPAGDPVPVEPVAEPVVEEPTPAEPEVPVEEPVTPEVPVAEVPTSEPAPVEPEPVVEATSATDPDIIDVPEPVTEPTPEEPVVDAPAVVEEPVVPVEPAPVEDVVLDAPIEPEAAPVIDDVPPMGDAPAEPLPVDVPLEGEPTPVEPEVATDAVDPEVPPTPVIEEPVATDAPVDMPALTEPAPVEPESVPVVDTDPVDGEGTSAWVDGVVVDAEVAVDDAAEAQVEVDALESDREELEDAVVALEELRGMLEGALEDPEATLTPLTMTLVRGEVGRILEPVGGLSTLPSTESEQSAKQISRMTLESIGDNIKEVWAAIVEAAKRIWEAIVEMYNRFFNMAASIKSGAEKVIVKSKSLNVNAKSKQAVENLTLAKKLAVGDSVKSTFAADFSKLVSRLTSVFDTSDDVVLGMLRDGANKLITSSGEADMEAAGAAVMKSVHSVGAGQVAFIKTLATGYKETKNAGVLTVESGVLIGNAALQVSIADISNRDIGVLVDKLRKSVSTQNTRLVKVQEATNGKLPILDDVESTMADVIALAESVIDYKSNMDAFTKAISEVYRQGSAAVSGQDHTWIESALYKGCLNTVTMMGPAMTRFNTRLIQYVGMIGPAVVQYGGEQVKLTQVSDATVPALA